VSNFLREGQFITLDKRVTFHFRESAGDALAGIFIYDRRDSGNAFVYSAERGRTLQNEGKSFLVLEKGVVQRLGSGSQGGGLVTFDRYAVDLSQLSEDAAIVAYRPRERSTYELLFPNRSASDYAREAPRLRAELHERLSFPLYPVVFTLIAFAALGTARTTRQGRSLAIGLAVIAAGAVRLIGYAISTRIVRSPALIPLIYVVPLLGGFAALILLRFDQFRPRFSAFSAYRKQARSPMPAAS
jgi:lipopolysaccharide export system permease protein